MAFLFQGDFNPRFPPCTGTLTPISVRTPMPRPGTANLAGVSLESEDDSKGFYRTSLIALLHQSQLHEHDRPPSHLVSTGHSER